MFNIGPWELALILVVALIVVGPGKLPDVAKAIGKGINEFKKVTTGYKRELQDAMDTVQEPVKQLIDEPVPEKKEENNPSQTDPVKTEKKTDQLLATADNFEADILGNKQEDTNDGTSSIPSQDK
ncbi:MAG: twin-arginine translocase TatA/TatE family subunit [Syntrophomonas sp.]|nr:twin-arginine translocase TatA/TatE family subunit [Syntrophomonas sp.]